MCVCRTAETVDDGFVALLLDRIRDRMSGETANTRGNTDAAVMERVGATSAVNTRAPSMIPLLVRPSSPVSVTFLV